MRITKMKLFKNADNNKITGFYGAKIRLSGVQNSRAVVMPVRPISSISIHQTGNANIYLTNYSFKDIKNDSEQWSLYDGISQINNGITAVKAENTTGSTVIQITVLRDI